MCEGSLNNENMSDKNSSWVLRLNYETMFLYKLLLFILFALVIHLSWRYAYINKYIDKSLNKIYKIYFYLMIYFIYI